MSYIENRKLLFDIKLEKKDSTKFLPFIKQAELGIFIIFVVYNFIFVRNISASLEFAGVKHT